MPTRPILVEVQHWPMVEDLPKEVEFEICTYRDTPNLPLDVDLIEEWNTGPQARFPRNGSPR